MRRLVLLLFSSIYILTSLAQTNTGELTFQMSLPQGGYKKTYPATGTGLMLSALHQMKKTPSFRAGIELGFLQISGKDKSYTGVYDNEYNTFLVASWNYIITTAALFRINLMPEVKPWNVFTEVSFGANLFTTGASVSREQYSDISRDFDQVKYYYNESHNDWSLRAGVSAGAEFPFGKKKIAAAVCKFSYLYGSKATYYAKPVFQGTQIILNPRQSQTSMLLTEAGIRLGLFNKKG
ncbi:MAG: hypothetical protein ABUL44_03730 [Flavobacterium sp.]